MTTPIVSVCMASYNHAPFIRIAVESVLRQSFTDWELVITDDGSADGTLAALDGITDDRLRIEGFPENRSACIALNHCIRRARGRFIAVLNSDDAWAPDKLAKQLAVMNEQPQTAAVFTRAAMIDERGQPLPPDHPYLEVFNQPNRGREAWLRQLLFWGNRLCHPSVLVRTDVYREVGLYDERLAQLPDLDMWIRMCFRHEIWVIQEQLTYFRLLDGERNASGSRPEVRIRTLNEQVLVCQKAFRAQPDRMAAMLLTPQVDAHVDSKAEATDPLRCLLDNPLTDTMQPGLRAAELLWMYDHLQEATWQDCKKFIAKTGAYDPFGLRQREQSDAQPAPKESLWEWVTRGRR